MYKYLQKYYKDAFLSRDELPVMTMAYSLRSFVEDESITLDYLYDVVRDINRKVLERREHDVSINQQYKLYLIVHNTMSIHHQLLYKKYTKNFSERANQKVDSLNEYINIKAVKEYFYPISIDTDFKKNIVAFSKKELGS